jgi:hypothetical protein
MTLYELYPHVDEDTLKCYCGVAMRDEDWQYLDHLEREEKARLARLRKPSPWFDN